MLYKNIYNIIEWYNTKKIINRSSQVLSLVFILYEKNKVFYSIVSKKYFVVLKF